MDCTVHECDPHLFYDFGGVIGRGSQSVVYSAIHKKTRKTYAIKKVDTLLLSYHQKNKLYNQIDILSYAKDEPHIITLHETYRTPLSTYLVLDLMDGGDLFDRIVEHGEFSESEARYVMRMLVIAIAFLHSKSIVHRDLKPENILFEAKENWSSLKICDFGLSKFAGEEETISTPCGTPAYVAPEVITASTYHRSVDMWSVGVIFYTMLCGYPPFFAAEEQQILDLVAKGIYSFPSPCWDNISPKAKDLIKHLLEKDPSKRYTAKQTLEHDWMIHNTQQERGIKQEKDSPKKNKALMRSSLNTAIEAHRDAYVIHSPPPCPSKQSKGKKKETKILPKTSESNWFELEDGIFSLELS